MADRVGQQFGSYRLARLLGEGAFAEVYLGEHLHLESLAAIKVLHAHLASADERQQFSAEARTIVDLVHPHIVRLCQRLGAGQQRAAARLRCLRATYHLLANPAHADAAGS